jgi:hypothetical protein
MTRPRQPENSHTVIVDLYVARGRLRAEIPMQGYDQLSELFNNAPGEFIGASMRMASVGDLVTTIRRDLVVRLRDVRLVRPVDEFPGNVWPVTRLDRIPARIVMDLDDWQVTGDVHLVDRIPWLDFAATAYNRFIPVTNASVRFVNVAEPLECEFLLVNGTRISALYEVA